MQAQQKLTFKVIQTVCNWNSQGPGKQSIVSSGANATAFSVSFCKMSKQVLTVKQLCLKWKVCTLNKQQTVNVAMSFNCLRLHVQPTLTKLSLLSFARFLDSIVDVRTVQFKCSLNSSKKSNRQQQKQWGINLLNQLKFSRSFCKIIYLYNSLCACSVLLFLGVIMK